MANQSRSSALSSTTPSINRSGEASRSRPSMMRSSQLLSSAVSQSGLMQLSTFQRLLLSLNSTFSRVNSRLAQAQPGQFSSICRFQWKPAVS